MLPPRYASSEIAVRGDDTNMTKDKPISNHPNRGRGRPPLPPGERKVNVTISLSPDVVAGWRAKGPGWMVQVDAALRAALA